LPKKDLQDLLKNCKNNKDHKKNPFNKRIRKMKKIQRIDSDQEEVDMPVVRNEMEQHAPLIRI